MKTALLTIGLAALLTARTALGAEPDSKDITHISGVDVYGTARLDGGEIWRGMKTDFDALERAIAAGDRPRIQEIKEQIAGRLKERGPFDYVALSPILYYAPTPGLYVTIDV